MRNCVTHRPTKPVVLKRRAFVRGYSNGSLDNPTAELPAANNYRRLRYPSKANATCTGANNNARGRNTATSISKCPHEQSQGAPTHVAVVQKFRCEVRTHARRFLDRSKPAVLGRFSNESLVPSPLRPPQVYPLGNGRSLATVLADRANTQSCNRTQSLLSKDALCIRLGTMVNRLHLRPVVTLLWRVLIQLSAARTG